jgi:biotin carboxylase
MSKPFLILIESNTTGTGRIFARKAFDRGYDPLVITENPDRYDYLRQDGIAFLQEQTSDIDGLTVRARHLAKEREVAGVFSSSEYFIEAAARIASALGLPGASANALGNCRNKWRQRRSMQQAGLHSPAFRLATSPKEAMWAAESIGLPVIVKPTVGTGSVGVRLCRTAAEVFQHSTTLLANRVNERGMPLPAEVLVEEYMIGPEYSAECFGGKVLGLTRKLVSPEPFFVELGHDYPAGTSPAVSSALQRETEAALEATGTCWGPVHAELRMGPRGPVVIEVNPRLAGGFIPELVRRAHGVDLISETIALVTGMAIHTTPSLDRHASIRFITPPCDGDVLAIDGLDDAARLGGVCDVRMYCRVGDKVRVWHDFRDRIGHVIACLDDRGAAASVAEQARSAIRLTVQSS